MNQLVRATLPIFIAALHLIQAAPPPVGHMLLLILISFGVHLVVSNVSVMSNEWLGVLLVTASVALQATQMCFAGHLLSTRLDPIQLIFYTSPFALLAAVVPALA